MTFLRSFAVHSLLAICIAGQVFAGNYPLQILLPRVAGTTPDSGREVLQSDHRTLYAYPGLVYRARAVVVGGDFPYVTYSLTNAPGDMAVSSAGLITWTAPASGTSGTVTLTVTDNLSATATSDFVVTVDATKFKFVDSEAGGGGDGSISSPFNSVVPLRDGTTGASDLIYFVGRTAPYTFRAAGAYLSGADYFRHVDFNGSRPKQWMALPGGTVPIIDLGGPNEDIAAASVNTTTDQLTVGIYGDVYTTGQWTFLSTSGTLPTVSGVALSATTVYWIIRVDATHIKLASSEANALAGTALDLDGAGTGTHYISHPFIRFSTASNEQATYFEGFEVRNIPNKGLNIEVNAHYCVIQDNYFHDQYGGAFSAVPSGGKNAGFIDRETGGSGSLSTDPQSEFCSSQYNIFEDWTGGSADKVYSLRKSLWANNTFRHGTALVYGTTNLPGGIELKGGYMLQPEVRQNTFEQIEERALNGNNHIVVGGEFRFNLIKADNAGETLQINQDGLVDTPLYFERNTILGRIGIVFETGDGPFHFSNNVIVNTDNAASPVNYFYSRAGTPNASQIIESNNLKGVTADGIVDANGLLTAAYESSRGSRGHEIVSSTTRRFSPGFLRRAENVIPLTIWATDLGSESSEDNPLAAGHP